MTIFYSIIDYHFFEDNSNSIIATNIWNFVNGIVNSFSSGSTELNQIANLVMKFSIVFFVITIIGLIYLSLKYKVRDLVKYVIDSKILPYE